MALVTTRGIDTLMLLNSIRNPRGLLAQALSRRCDGVQRHLGWRSFSITANGRSVLGHASSSSQSLPKKSDNQGPRHTLDDRTEPIAYFNPATLPPHVKTWLEDPKCCTSIPLRIKSVTASMSFKPESSLFSDLFRSGVFQTWTETTSTEARSPPLQDTLKRRTRHCGQAMFDQLVGAL